VATTLESDADASGRPLPDDRLRDILRLLKLARYVDERLEALYRQGRLPGAIYSGRGQEGTHVGVAYALDARDSLYPTHRDLTAQLAKGLDLNRVLAQFWGRIDGYLRGRDGNSHIGDWDGNRTYAVMSHLPIAYPVAVGAGWAYQRAGDGRVALAICGDGATSNGRWHEAINTAAVFRLPVIFVVNNNQFAYSTPNEREFPVPTIAERAAAYGIPGVRVDGTEVLEVYEAARDAVERARSGGGPTLIESVSLRWRGHAGHDPAKYVPRELLEHYMLSKDPVKNFEQHLRELGVVDDDAVTAMDAEVQAAFEQAHEYALASPFPEPGDVSLGVWVEDGYWEREPGRGGGTEAG
jgi:TPP-dependent pyruvate/acetoin dehydrogenase alpha subunit